MKKNNFFDGLEIRTNDERNTDHLNKVNQLIEQALNNKNQSLRLNGKLNDLNDLSSVPLLRKSELTNKQSEDLPFANLNVSEIKNFAHIYRSPGPIYDLDGHSQNWWRLLELYMQLILDMAILFKIVFLIISHLQGQCLKKQLKF